MTDIQGFSNEEIRKVRKNRFLDFDLEDLEDLGEHIDAVSFNLGKVYHRAKDRSRKQSFRNSLKKKFHHIYKNEKSGLF